MKRIGILILICSFLGCCPVSSYVGVYYNNQNGCEQVLRLNKDKTYKYIATYNGKKIEDYGKWEPSKSQGSCRINIYDWERFIPRNDGYKYDGGLGIHQLILRDNRLILNLDNSDYDLIKQEE
ncbi:MAG: hypothetical protein DWP98_04490 [Bacteroidetes bacterium]|nr:MAG: hypothetical protein DWP98_04490 [Bacteroidota bacterium]MBL1144683.1 hypothetical protein [Bacteroidota bacterium]NOG57477.1 hypothetical protein [Bacteroidota bacterium]